MREDMIWNSSILLFALLLHALKPTEKKLGRRNKRVLFGHPGLKDERDSYPSFRYYVFLAKGATLEKIDEKDPIADWLGLNPPLPRELVCGGVLLTPSIVQTACHCISNFFIGRAGQNLSQAFPKNVWEDRIYSYVGSNIVINMQTRLTPKHYITYQKCRKLEGMTQYNLFDYGLIISGDSVAQKNPDAPISYAPVYIATDLLAFYYEALEKEFMCLLIGHGPHETDYDDQDILIVDNEPSMEIRWGWRTVMSYLDCSMVSYNIQDRSMYYFNVTRDSTWVCAQSFSARDSDYYVNTQGDSGGPMTCNDVYFSVFSMTTPIVHEDVISYSGPIVNTHFENAAEYRDNLIMFIQNFMDDGRPKPHPVDPRVTVTPPPIPFLANAAPFIHLQNLAFLLFLVFNAPTSYEL